MTIRAKPTKYCGVQFRSRTEAKYCMLFNMFDVPWTYESKRFHLPSGSYLPDFYLPSWNTWIEIKGPSPTNGEMLLCEELKLVTKQNVIICYGWPPSVLIFNGVWIKGSPFGILNTRLILGGKPLPENIYQEINEKIYTKSIRPPASKKRKMFSVPRTRRRKS